MKVAAGGGPSSLGTGPAFDPLGEPAAAADRSFGADRDWLLRFAPPSQSSALAALFTVEHEVLASLRSGIEHRVAHLRLEWWQEELARLATGRPRHPATRLLADAARARAATPPDLAGLIEHVRVDLATVAFADRGELDAHLEHWARSVFREAALCDPQLAAADPRVRATAEWLAARAGCAVRELELLTEFTRHARDGRIYTPLGDAPESYANWSAEPLGESERATLMHRAEGLCSVLREAAQMLDVGHRRVLRVPLLWMAFACARQVLPADLSRGAAPVAPLRRTIGAWRDALRITRGGLPRALQMRTP